MAVDCLLTVDFGEENVGRSHYLTRLFQGHLVFGVAAEVGNYPCTEIR